MATSTTGYDFPTMMQQFYAPKSARGSRLGRGPAMASTMVQYGYSQPGTNINVSPTFSNIGNPDVYTEGLSIGDVSLGDFGGFDGGFDEEAPTATPEAPAGPTGGTSGGSTGGGTSSKGGGEKIGTSLKVSGGIQEALQKAAKKGQTNDPRVTRGELRSIFKQGDIGAKGLRNAVYEGKVQLGGKAADFLNRQLGKVGAKPMPKVQTKSDPEPISNKPTPQAPIGLINKAGIPGTTNLKATPTQQAKKQEPPKKQAPKLEAKNKAQAKSNSKKKK